jgi:hypothetical protein
LFGDLAHHRENHASCFLLMGLLSFLGYSKSKSQQAQSPPASEFDKALVTLKVNNDTALFMLLAEDGTVNRMGDGSTTNTDREMFIGRHPEPLFARFISRITPDLLEHQGAYDLPNRKGANCELTLLLGYRGSERSAGFKFIYGSESQGPPREIAELVRYAAELTTPWHEAQKRIAKSEK